MNFASATDTHKHGHRQYLSTQDAERPCACPQLTLISIGQGLIFTSFAGEHFCSTDQTPNTKHFFVPYSFSYPCSYFFSPPHFRFLRDFAPRTLELIFPILDRRNCHDADTRALKGWNFDSAHSPSQMPAEWMGVTATIILPVNRSRARLSVTLDCYEQIMFNCINIRR